LAKWKLEQDCLTAGGNPKQYAHAEVDGLSYDYMFCLRAERKGGGRDTVNNPRRIVALGRTRDEAWHQLRQSIRLFDTNPTYPENRERA